jgi:hypothetical protein
MQTRSSSVRPACVDLRRVWSCTNRGSVIDTIAATTDAWRSSRSSLLQFAEPVAIKRAPPASSRSPPTPSACRSRLELTRRVTQRKQLDVVHVQVHAGREQARPAEPERQGRGRRRPCHRSSQPFRPTAATPILAAFTTVGVAEVTVMQPLDQYNRVSAQTTEFEGAEIVVAMSRAWMTLQARQMSSSQTPRGSRFRTTVAMPWVRSGCLE